MRRRWTASSLAGLCALAGLCTLAACSSSPTATHPGGPSSRVDTPAAFSAAASAASSVAARAPAASSAPTRPGAGQASEAVPAPPRVTVTRMRTADGSVVTVATFTGPVTYVLHDGSEDPGAAVGRVQAGPAVAGAERKRLLAAFNGGFKLSAGAGAGGYEQEGHVASPLRPGLASLVIDRSGQARIGIWGRGVPAPGEAVYSVRQNLPALVMNGKPAAAAADPGLWGATLGGGEHVARSALGQDASGDLIFAASMSTTPADLAFVLAYAGARTAMELDINPEWVQLDVATHPGGSLRASLPGQDRPADQYLAGWARDFITVLAPLPPAAATALPSRRIRP